MPLEDDDLPDDDEEAFLELERRYRRDCDQDLHNAFIENPPLEVHFRYISRVLAACKALDIDGLHGWQLPSFEDFNLVVFHDFTRDVGAFAYHD